MKNNILLTSVGSAVVATIVGITGVLTQDSGIDSIVASFQMYQAATMLGLLSIATFFVGWVYPSSTATSGNGKVLNIKGRRGA